MTELHLADAALAPAPLVVDREVTLGAAVRDAPGEQLDRISLGRPACIPLDPASVDEDARVFLADKPGSSFWLLALICSFRALADEPIQRAWLEVRLRTEAPDGAADPTAWSMEPGSLSKTVHVTSTTRLDASLKLTSPGVPIEIGPAVSKEGKSEYETDLPYVEAYREGTARPSWTFTRTPNTDVRGTHRLRCVIELPSGSSARADVSAGATLQLKLLGLIPYRASLDHLPAQQFVAFGQ